MRDRAPSLLQVTSEEELRHSRVGAGDPTQVLAYVGGVAVERPIDAARAFAPATEVRRLHPQATGRKMDPGTGLDGMRDVEVPKESDGSRANVLQAMPEGQRRCITPERDPLLHAAGKRDAVATETERRLRAVVALDGPLPRPYPEIAVVVVARALEGARRIGGEELVPTAAPHVVERRP